MSGLKTKTNKQNQKERTRIKTNQNRSAVARRTMKLQKWLAFPEVRTVRNVELKPFHVSKMIESSFLELLRKYNIILYGEVFPCSQRTEIISFEYESVST